MIFQVTRFILVAILALGVHSSPAIDRKAGQILFKRAIGPVENLKFPIIRRAAQGKPI
uniref:Secreted protein n=1 Tax=Phakopsora pachyrhizi TaxID=170000 RepID=A0A0S1MK59_PHAPC